MKSIKLIILVVASSIFIISCEKKIDLELNESEQQIVVEGIVHDNLGDNYVLLSKTRAYDNNEAIETISNAKVKITDNLGTVYELDEVDTIPGYYTNASLTGVAGRAYNLEVNINGEVITANSTMDAKSQIDSLSYEEETDFTDEDTTQYRLYCHFTDPANVKNYYRLKAFGKDGQKDGYISLTDDYFDGISTFFPLFEMFFDEGETVTVQLLTVDEANHRYFTAVYSSQGGEVPGNPPTNLIGEKAVGYFGAYAKSEVTVIIGE